MIWKKNLRCRTGHSKNKSADISPSCTEIDSNRDHFFTVGVKLPGIVKVINMSAVRLIVFFLLLLYERLSLTIHCYGYVSANVYPALLPGKRKTTFQKLCFDELVSLLAASLSHGKQCLACGLSAAFREVGVHHIAAAAYAILSHFSHCTYVLGGRF